MLLTSNDVSNIQKTSLSYNRSVEHNLLVGLIIAQLKCSWTVEYFKILHGSAATDMKCGGRLSENAIWQNYHKMTAYFYNSQSISVFNSAMSVILIDLLILESMRVVSIK